MNTRFAYVAAAALLASCGLLSGPSRSDYTEDQGFEVRMIVDTPSGPKVGRSVMHRWAWNEVSPIFGKRAGVRFVGEAVPVDLDDGRTIYMTLDGRTGSGSTFGHSVPWNAHAAVKLTRGFTGWVQVPEEDWPSIAVFDRPNDPLSIRRIVTEQPGSLGKGYSVRSILVRHSDEEPTHQIMKRLPWMSRYYSKNMDGSTVTRSNDFVASTSSDAFIRKF